MRTVLVIPRISIQDANAISSPYTIGFPAMTGWAGGVHALQRRINEKTGSHVTFKSFGVTCHQFELGTYKNQGDFVSSIVGKGSPLKKDGSRPSFIEDGRCNLSVSLVIECEGLPEDAEELDRFTKNLRSYIYSGLRFAGGDIISHGNPEIIVVDSEKSLRKLNRQLMPGYCLIERRDLMQESMVAGRDGIDALLDHLKIENRSTLKEGGNVEWEAKRKTFGWIIPIATGFLGITDIGYAENQRDSNTPHRFAESIVTLGEFVMPFRITNLDDMLWHSHFYPHKNLYLIQQH
ncbi:type I-F CRISPR-associated protein Csy2 [Methylomonas sp. AM2-LC]|uniref:type I-F CRISPR-associated protein Csy2 n=1 Tax=Methylomonas sp. AM2-LC TaxID=3153301 RepID=UPI00326562B4